MWEVFGWCVLGVCMVCANGVQMVCKWCANNVQMVCKWCVWWFVERYGTGAALFVSSFMCFSCWYDNKWNGPLPPLVIPSQGLLSQEPHFFCHEPSLCDHTMNSSWFLFHQVSTLNGHTLTGNGQDNNVLTWAKVALRVTNPKQALNGPKRKKIPKQRKYKYFTSLKLWSPKFKNRFTRKTKTIFNTKIP